MNEGVVTADALCEPPGSARMKLKTLPLPERPLYPTTFPRHRRTTVFFQTFECSRPAQTRGCQFESRPH